VPTEYVKYFVLGEWNLRVESLKIRLEKEEESTVLKAVEFPINERSKEKCGEVLNDYKSVRLSSFVQPLTM